MAKKKDEKPNPEEKKPTSPKEGGTSKKKPKVKEGKRKTSVKRSTAKKSASASSKKSSKNPSSKKRGRPALPPGKKKRKKKRPQRGQPRQLKRWNSVQKIYSAFLKKQDIHVGRYFNKQAAEIYRRTKDQPLKYIRQNIATLYDEWIEQKDVEREFPDNIDYFSFSDRVQDPRFENVVIKVYFKDDMAEFAHEGYSLEIDNWYRYDGLYKHLRQFYDTSPVAKFQIDGTDNKTFVNYVVASQDIPPEEAEEIFKKQKEVDVAEPEFIAKKKKEEEIDEKGRRKLDIELTREKKLLAKEKAKLVKELREAGFTKNEIKEQLKDL